MLNKITNSDFNMVALAWMDGGTRNLYTKKPVRQIADLKGMKIRVQGNPVFIDTINDMGGNGIAMATGEIFSALQTGVIDGAENNTPTFLEHNHYQNAKYFTWTDHLILPEPIVIAKTTWLKLSPEQQALVQKVAREAQMEERTLWDKSLPTLKPGSRHPAWSSSPSARNRKKPFTTPLSPFVTNTGRTTKT